MSKAEDFAIKKYPVSIEDIHGHKIDVNLWQRKACVDGYHQAEKDLELTVEDIVHIIETYNELEFSREFATVTFNDTCKEVLKRFKEQNSQRMKQDKSRD